MLTKQEILNTLPNFYGTEAYFRYSSIFKNFLLTDVTEIYGVPA